MEEIEVWKKYFSKEIYSNNFVVNIGFRFNKTTTTDYIGIRLSFSRRKTDEKQKQQSEHICFLGQKENLENDFLDKLDSL